MNETGLIGEQLVAYMPFLESLLLTIGAVFALMFYRFLWKKIKK